MKAPTYTLTLSEVETIAANIIQTCTRSLLTRPVIFCLWRRATVVIYLFVQTNQYFWLLIGYALLTCTMHHMREKLRNRYRNLTLAARDYLLASCGSIKTAGKVNYITSAKSLNFYFYIYIIFHIYTYYNKTNY